MCFMSGVARVRRRAGAAQSLFAAIFYYNIVIWRALRGGAHEMTTRLLQPDDSV